MTLKTPEQIAAETYRTLDRLPLKLSGGKLREIMVAAIEADRAQRNERVFVVQNDTGDVVDVFRDHDEAAAEYKRPGYSIIEESVWESGEFTAAQQEASS